MRILYIFVFFTWLATGQGQLGMLEIFPPIIGGWEQAWRGVVLIGAIGLGSYVVFLFLSNKLTDLIEEQLPTCWPKGQIFIASIVATAGTVTCTFFITFSIVVPDTVNDISILAYVLIGTFVCAASGTLSVAIGKLMNTATTIAIAASIAGAIAVAGAVFSVGISAIDGAVIGSGVVAVASAVAVAIGVASANVGSGRSSVGGPVSTVAVAGAVTVTGAGVGGGAISISVFSAVAGSVIFYLIDQYLTVKQTEQNRSEFWLSMAYLLGMMFLALFIVFVFGKAGKLVYGMMGWVALGFLPVINAFFDVVSLQLSRFLVGKIKQDHRYWNIGWMVADVLVAILLLIGLYWAIFLSLEAVDRLLFPEVELFAVDRWRDLLWQQRDWFHPEILWLTLMASTTLIVTGIHLVFAFAHLFVPLWHRSDKEKIAGLIGQIRSRTAAHPADKVPEADCRALARAYYFPWEHGIVLGTLVLWGLGYVLYTFVIRG
uniref:Uncharacterized protein n=1 Tax=Candidatus Kentrum sp. FW TaxID=2126338 RepID=A0A450T787_9GAMM|nr:MAG: hypothetical protein BECKFW1821C_GA0114237_100240 [Candidatus Kentron sp. FW]